MPDAVILNISEKSDEPILKTDNGSKIKLCGFRNLAFIFIMVLPLTVTSAAILLYPFPPQIDVFLQRDNLIPRTEFNALKTEFYKTEKKLLSINNDMTVPYISYDTYLGYKIAKEMLEEYKTDLESNIQQQRILWKQCIDKNLETALDPIRLQLQTFVTQIICFSITVLFFIILIYGIARNSFKSDSKILFNLCFFIQLFFIVLTEFLSIIASMYYSEIWKLNSDSFLDLL